MKHTNLPQISTNQIMEEPATVVIESLFIPYFSKRKLQPPLASCMMGIRQISKGEKKKEKKAG